MKYIFLILLVSMLFSASRYDDNKSLRFACWGLESVQYTQEGVKRFVTKSKPYLVFKDSVFYGDSGCNDFDGSFSVKSDTIVFRRPAATKQGCDAIEWIEDALFRNLMNGKAKYVISGDTLNIYAKNTDVFRFYKKGDSKLCPR